MDKKLFNENKLFEELHPSLNKEIDFSKIYDTSSKLVTWQCTKDIRHVWKQRIRSRTKQGYGCSYCSGHRTLPEESLATLYPKVTAEIHPEKNPNFDARTRSPASNKVVHWICSNGHEWKSRVENRTKNKDTGCPTCRKRKNSFASKYPRLLQEWHPSKNNSFDPWELTSGSNKKVWWKCTKNPDHDDWERTIATRVYKDSGCPKCVIAPKKTIRKNKPLPLLSIYSKEISEQWHPSKNGGKLPSEYTAGSVYKAWWLCSVCKNEWQSTIKNRARQNKGCPACASRTRGKSRQIIGASIVQTHPELIPIWHKTLNKELKPEQFTYGSAQKIWWQCLTNENHNWSEKIVLMTKKHSLECKICKKEANSLQTNYPQIAAEWHPTKNGNLTPNDVSQAAGQMIWWQCHVNPEHEWQADVRNRTKNKSNCYQCSLEKTAIHLRNPSQTISPEDVEIFHVFSSSLESLFLLLELPLDNNKRLIQPMYRMIYSSTITALESFLSDAFKNKVIKNNDRTLTVIKSNTELNTSKYSIEEIVDCHSNVELKVIEFLSNLIWHNIYNVKKLYKDTLDISFPENTSEIIKAVGIRHDLVHRNGKTKRGGMHILGKSDVESLIKETEQFVSQIQKQLIKLT